MQAGTCPRPRGHQTFSWLTISLWMKGQRILDAHEPNVKEQTMIDPKLLEILACPACKGDLIYDEKNQKLICERCRLKYSIRDDIPIMLVDQAEKC